VTSTLRATAVATTAAVVVRGFIGLLRIGD